MLKLLLLSALPLVAQSSGVGVDRNAHGDELEIRGPWPVAQMVERLARNQEVGGSNPHPVGKLVKPSTPDSLQFHYSLIALGAANTLDVLSSRGGYELNPVLGRGDFGARQIGIKGGVIAAVVIGEVLLVRRWPWTARPLKWINLGDSAVTAGIAIRNWETR